MSKTVNHQPSPPSNPWLIMFILIFVVLATLDKLSTTKRSEHGLYVAILRKRGVALSTGEVVGIDVPADDRGAHEER